MKNVTKTEKYTSGCKSGYKDQFCEKKLFLKFKD